MSLINVTITPIDTGLTDIIYSLKQIGTGALPNTVHAVKVCLTALQYTWKSYAMGATVPGTSIRIVNPGGEYARSIKISSGGLGGTVFSDSPHAKYIEEGIRATDLKQTLPFGKKSRMGKNGPYLIVPFQHGTPDSHNAPMPNAFYAQLRQLIKDGEFKTSMVKKQTYSSANAAGEMIKRRTYQWGSKAQGVPLSNLEGMVVFNVPSSKKEKRGGYITFRIISANPPKKNKEKWRDSWVVPARDGLKLASWTVTNTTTFIQEQLQAGIRKDIFG